MTLCIFQYVSILPKRNDNNLGVSSAEIVLFFAYMDVGNRETHGAVSDQHLEAQDVLERAVERDSRLARVAR